MTHTRRLFLKQTGLMASAIALTGIGCAGGATKKEGEADTTAVAVDSSSSKVAEHTLAQFGLQLYTLRDDLPKDVKGTLKQVADMGYKQIEGFEGSKGLFWGMTNKEFKTYCDSLGLDFIAAHCDTKKDFEKKAAQAAEIGMKYLISPYEGTQKSVDDYKKIADKFNRLGDICKKNGIRFAYHNHAYPFVAIDGQIPEDIFLKNTNPETVDFELDIYWAVTGGADPIEFLNKYPNRYRLCHVKDRRKGADPKDEDASVDMGTGSIDYKKILKVAEQNGMQYYILEQEKYDNSTPFKSAAAGAKYLKEITI